MEDTDGAPTPEQRADWREQASRFTAWQDARRILRLLDALDAAEAENARLRDAARALEWQVAFAAHPSAAVPSSSTTREAGR